MAATRNNRNNRGTETVDEAPLRMGGTERAPDDVSQPDAAEGARVEVPPVVKEAVVDLSQLMGPPIATEPTQARRRSRAPSFDKPNKHTFFRTHPEWGRDMDQATGLLIIEDQAPGSFAKDRYLVSPVVLGQSARLQKLVRQRFSLRFVATTEGRHMVVPVRRPTGPDDHWAHSFGRGIEAGVHEWVKLVAVGGAYDIWEMEGHAQEPEWPDEDWPLIIDRVFHGRIIDSAAHPVIERLTGQKGT